MSPRPALHQRSESDTNARAFPNPASTLKIVHRSSTSSESKPANHGKPNSSSTSTVSRSGTVRSQVSFESLPPVQPLQIRKSRSSKASFGIFQDPEPVVEYALQGGPSCSSVPPTPVSGREPTQQKQPCTPPKMPTPPPRSILKKPSRPTLTPCTEEEYLNKSCEWISNQTSEYTPHRARMNSHTLRLVHDEDEFDIAVSRPRVGDDEISEIETTPTSTLSRSASDAQSTRSVRVPDWAKYFYGRRGGRISVIVEPQSESAHDSTIRSIPAATAERRPRTAGSMRSIAEIPRFFHRSKDTDSTTIWSLPHLDHIPSSYIENFNRQLFLFCLGFILPLCWWVAAFLPLPEEPPSSRRSSGDLEAGAADLTISKEAKKADAEYERRFINARFWRRVNRVLSVVGILVIAAIVALAVMSKRK